MGPWLLEQLLKLILTLCLSGITWVIVTGPMAMTVPFLIIFLVWFVIVFGGFLIIKHSDGDWDIF
jgi:hypothetical protein